MVQSYQMESSCVILHNALAAFVKSPPKLPTSPTFKYSECIKSASLYCPSILLADIGLVGLTIPTFPWLGVQDLILIKMVPNIEARNETNIFEILTKLLFVWAHVECNKRVKIRSTVPIQPLSKNTEWML